MARITDLPRNDAAAAIAFYRAEVAAGTWRHTQGSTLLRLQDDPAELRGLLAAAAKEPDVAAQLARIPTATPAPVIRRG